MNRNVFLWTLYDFANSIVLIVFFLYFSQWLVIDKGVADIWYNAIFAAASLLLLFTAPVFGSIADKTGKERQYFNRITILSFVAFLFTALIVLFASDDVFLAAFSFLCANYFYQFSFVFYNSFLYRIAPPEKWGKVSGIGQTGNWLGEIAGLLIAMPFAGGALYLLGETGRAQTFLPAVVLFFILALPMLLFFKLPPREGTTPHVRFLDAYKDQWGQFKGLIKAPGMGMFLLAYFFFNDAIITASNNFPIYLDNVFSIADTVKSLLLVGILVTAAFGAFFSGWVADKIGLKKALMIVLGSWVVLFPLLALASNLTIFVGLTILMGFFFGSIWTVSRAAMTALCPKEKIHFGFSFYTLAERVSTLVGPLAWGLITYFFMHLGATRYRIALFSMAFFVAFGIFILRKVPIEKAP